MTVEAVAPEMTEAEARQASELIRSALDRVANDWAELARLVSDAYQRRADKALGYSSWAEYAEAELRPSGQLATEVRRQIVGMLSAEGMPTRKIAPVVGVRSPDTVHRDLVQLSDDRTTADRIDPATGEVIETSDRVTGEDGKSYPRTKPKRAPQPEPEPAETKPKEADVTSRLAIPQPPKYGGGRLKHNRVLTNTVLGLQGYCIALDEITNLDGSVNENEAARLADDLARIIRSLKRTQQLLKKEL